MNDNKISSLTDLIKNKQEKKKQEDIAEEVSNLIKHGKIGFITPIDDDTLSNFELEIKSLNENKEGNIDFEYHFDTDGPFNSKTGIVLATDNGKLIEHIPTDNIQEDVAFKNKDITELEINAFLDNLNNERKVELSNELKTQKEKLNGMSEIKEKIKQHQIIFDLEEKKLKLFLEYSTKKFDEMKIKAKTEGLKETINLEINAFLDKFNNENILESEQSIKKPDIIKKTSKILPFKK